MSSSSTLPNLKIKKIRVVVHTMGPVIAGGQLSQNHWPIFFLLESGGCVRMHMELADPKSSKLNGKLDIKKYDYELSNSAVKYWDFAVPSNLIVGAILGLIKDEGRNRYIMAEGGVGCRHWTVVTQALPRCRVLIPYL